MSVALALLAAPRIALIALAFSTRWIQVSFSDEWLLPLSGLLVLPWTTLAWVLVEGPSRGLSPSEFVLLAFAFLMDLYSYGRFQAFRGRQVEG